MQPYDATRYELLRPAEIQARRDAAPIAYLVAGTLEWHGLQNPLGTDSLKAHAICCEAALQHGGVVLPPFYQGLLGDENWGPAGWEGYTLGFNQPEVFEAAMLGIAQALVSAGWKVLVGVTGHDVDAQRDAMARAIQAATADHQATGFAVMEGEMHRPDQEIPFDMDHAGAWETSCMLHVAPGRVDLAELTSRGLANQEDLEMDGPEGIGGKTPLRYASAALGQRIIARRGDQIGSRARAAWEALRENR
ncbi:MAG: creatininase family protein [Anaerolineae bacterium]